MSDVLVSPRRALEAARVAREADRLRVALRALDYAHERLEAGSDLAVAGLEGERLAEALAARGAALAALGEWLRARAAGSDPGKSLARVLRDYDRWRPRAASLGVPRDGLMAGASGAFWVDRRRKGRLLVLQGGITGEANDAFTRVLDLSSKQVQWLFVDMARLSYVGSTGLAVVVKTAERLRGAGGGVSLFALSSNLKLLVETLGLAKFLNPTADLGEALELTRG